MRWGTRGFAVTNTCSFTHVLKSKAAQRVSRLAEHDLEIADGQKFG
jgi:hypothetical protein